MSYTITNGILTCTFSVSAKNSSGQFTISATIRNTDSATRAVGNPRLSCSLDNSSNWQRVGTSSLNAGASYSGSTTFSTGSTSAGTVYCYLMTDYLSGSGGRYSVPAYVDPTPVMSPVTLSISPSEQTMGNVVTVSETGGYYATVSQRQVRYNNSTIASYSSGNWRPSVNDFQQYCTSSNSVNVQLRAYCTASSGATGTGYSNTVSLKLNLPSNYLPTATHTYQYINDVNNGLVAGVSQLKVTLDPSVTPSDNIATITNYELYSVNPVPSNDSIPITTSSFTKSGYDFTSAVLPVKSGVPSYQFTLTFKIIDSRGNVAYYTTNDTFRVTNFVHPYVSITNLRRTSATQGLLQLTIEGESSTHPSRIDNSNNTTASVTVNGQTPVTTNVKTNLTQTSTGYTLSYTIPNLSSGSQYNITFTYRDTTMASYNEGAYQYTQTLSTLAMPLSLYDNGSNMFASFGEECQDSYSGATSPTVINFAMGSQLRATSSGGVSVISNAYDIVNVQNAITNITTNILGSLKFVALTDVEYEELAVKDQDTIYFVYEE